MAAVDLRALGRSLAVAIAACDTVALDRLYARDARIWHSTDEITMSREDVIATVRGIAAVASGQVVIKEQFVLDDVLIQTQTVTYEVFAGSATSFDAALVIRVDALGRIVRLDEYLDRSRLQPVIDALSVGA